MIISLFIIHYNIRTPRERGSPSTPPKGYYNNMYMYCNNTIHIICARRELNIIQL